jgi:hypothetical protein
MYVLVETGSTPDTYVTLADGFFGWTTSENAALQFARSVDAQAVQAIITEPTTVVQVGA